MAIKLSGLASGMDTEAIIKELMSAQSLKKKKIEQKQTKLTWKQERWKELNTKLYSFYTGILSRTRKEGSFNGKKVSSSNETIASATASNSAPNGTHSLEVSQLASSQFITGGVIKREDGGTVIKTTTLADLGIAADTVITISAAKKPGQEDDDKSNIQKLTVTDSTTISDFISSCQKAGLNASFDNDQKRIFISSHDSGLEQKFTILTTSVNAEYTAKKEELDQSINYNMLSEEKKKKADEAYEAIRKRPADPTKYAEALAKLKELKIETDYAKNVQMAVDEKYENFINGKYNDRATSIFNDYKDATTWLGSAEGAEWQAANPGSVTPEERTAAFQAAKTKALSQMGNRVSESVFNDYTSKDAWLNSENGQEWLAEKPGATDAEREDAYQAALAAKTLEVTTAIKNSPTAEGTAFKDKVAKEAMEKYSMDTISAADLEAIKIGAGLELTQDAYAANHDTEISDGLKTLAAEYAALDAEAAAGQAPDGNSLLTKLGLAEITGDQEFSATTAGNVSGLTVTTAKNAKFVLDGAAMETSSNNSTVNFITLNLKSLTAADNPVQIVVSNDTEGSYKMVKDFVNEFNTLLKEMNDLYYADSAKGYEPLSSEEKESMTDDEVEKWEKKIKDSILRRDGTLDSLIVSMKNSLMQQITIDGKTASLASFGIHTSSDYTEKGLLHIYGDSDDSLYSANDNELMEMLKKDPDLVMKGISKLAGALYDTMNEKMGRTSLSSALKFYNDKELDKQSKEYSSQIKTWEKKLAEMENRYYKQFTAMEVAMSKLNNQSNSLASLLGTSN